MKKSRSSQKYSVSEKSPCKMSWKIVGIVTSAIFIVISAGLSTLIWAVHTSSTDAAATPPITASSAGRFVGVITASKIYGSSYVAYRSIPFAKPPIGDLRFKHPQPLDDVKPGEVVNSDKYQKSCWSVTKKSTDPLYGEDCLYLNVYVPGNGEAIHEDKKLPVMVWIHGGGFVAGGTFPEPDKLVVQGNVIVVSINYRLGVFGFLTTNEDELPSNLGLWDQYLAIKWVKDYIHFFGGDNESITIFGESSGAISTALHVLSPITSPLFSKAILQSGAATSLISRYYKQRAEEFSIKVGCPITTSRLMADCLRTVSVEDILKFSLPSAYNIPLAQKQFDFIWMPIVDGKFIPDEPLKLLNNVKYLKDVNAFNKDLLFGILNNEGSLIVDHILTPIQQAQLDINFVSDLTDGLLHARYGLDYNVSNEIRKEIYSFYTGFQVLNSAPIPQNVIEFAGDVIFNVPAIEMALALSKCHQSVNASCLSNLSDLPAQCTKTTSKIFLYQFDYCPQTDICKLPCMTHGLDVSYEFPKSNFTNPDEQKLSDNFVNILTTFARYSDPGTALACEWPLYDTATQRYLQFDVSPSVRRYLFDYRVKFWLTLSPYS